MAERSANAGAMGPLASGGSVILVGPDGAGALELTEYATLYALQYFSIQPVFATMGPRVDLEQFGLELLRSLLAIVRLKSSLSSGLPDDDVEAIRQLIGASAKPMELVEEAFSGLSDDNPREPVVLKLVEAAAMIARLLLKEIGLMVVLHLDYGTNVSEKTLEMLDMFWPCLTLLSRVPYTGPDAKQFPFLLWIVCREVDETNGVFKAASGKGHVVQLTGLSESLCQSYISSLLDVQVETLSESLVSFVLKLTKGIPRDVREVITQLQALGHLKDQDKKTLSHTNLDAMDLAAIAPRNFEEARRCLDDLEPLEVAVLRMSSAFSEPFTFTDLMADVCSRWSNATRLDVFLYFHALQALKKKGLIEASPSPGSAKEPQTFFISDQLLAKVASETGPKVFRRVIKRQALIERVLMKELPGRIDEIHKKRQEPRIPWFYENMLKNV